MATTFEWVPTAIILWQIESHPGPGIQLWQAINRTGAASQLIPPKRHGRDTCVLVSGAGHACIMGTGWNYEWTQCPRWPI